MAQVCTPKSNHTLLGLRFLFNKINCKCTRTSCRYTSCYRSLLLMFKWSTRKVSKFGRFKENDSHSSTSGWRNKVGIWKRDWPNKSKSQLFIISTHKMPQWKVKCTLKWWATKFAKRFYHFQHVQRSLNSITLLIFLGLYTDWNCRPRSVRGISFKSFGILRLLHLPQQECKWDDQNKNGNAASRNSPGSQGKRHGSRT